MGKMSAGMYPSVTRSLLKAVKRSRTQAEKRLNQLKAWKNKRTDPWITIDNPDTSNKREPFIRVRASTIWGNPKVRVPFKTSED
jgi:hypothetical protein